MTLLEKVYWTLLAVNVILFAIFLFLDADWVDRHIDACWWMVIPFISQVGGTFLYLIIKLLFWIWGEPIDAFPSCWFL